MSHFISEEYKNWKADQEVSLVAKDGDKVLVSRPSEEFGIIEGWLPADLVREETGSSRTEARPASNVIRVTAQIVVEYDPEKTGIKTPEDARADFMEEFAAGNIAFESGNVYFDSDDIVVEWVER